MKFSRLLNYFYRHISKQKDSTSVTVQGELIMKRLLLLSAVLGLVFTLQGCIYPYAPPVGYYGYGPAYGYPAYGYRPYSYGYQPYGSFGWGGGHYWRGGYRGGFGWGGHHGGGFGGGHHGWGGRHGRH
jgi:hypothetical protein